MLITVTALLLARHAPAPEYIAFSSVIISLAFAVCFMACTSFAKHGCLLRLHGRCIQQRIYMCCVKVSNRPRAVRRWWVKQPSKGALNGFATNNRPLPYLTELRFSWLCLRFMIHVATYAHYRALAAAGRNNYILPAQESRLM